MPDDTVITDTTTQAVGLTADAPADPEPVPTSPDPWGDLQDAAAALKKAVEDAEAIVEQSRLAQAVVQAAHSAYQDAKAVHDAVVADIRSIEDRVSRFFGL